MLDEGQNFSACHALVRHPAQLVPDDRVVGHNELDPPLDRLLDDLRGDVQGHQHVGDGLLPVADQKACVVEAQLGPEGGLLVQQSINFVYRCHVFHVSFVASSSSISARSAARAAGSGALPRSMPSKARLRRRIRSVR